MNKPTFIEQNTAASSEADSEMASEIAALKTKNSLLEERLDTLEKYVKQLAHDLKTPLTPLVGASDLLASSVNELPWSDLAQSIKLSSENLLRMVDELLDLERCNCNKLNLNYALFDPKQTVTEESMKVESSTRPSRATVYMNLPSGPTFVWADEKRLRQVIAIFLLDSLKFSPVGGKITVSIIPTDKLTRFTVEDAGIRIAEMDLPHLFEPYQSRDGQRRRVGNNGFALAKRLIELQGGRIGADSAPERGNTFWFDLAARKSDCLTGVV